MRTIVLISLFFAVALAAPAQAQSTLAERLHKVHDMMCPTDAPCNYCTSVSTPHIAIEPSNEPWGTACRFKSTTGWRKGIVYTFYPDKPFPVNWKKK